MPPSEFSQPPPHPGPLHRAERTSTHISRRPGATYPGQTQNTVIFANASGTMGLTPAAGGAALGLQPNARGQLRQHHLTGTTIFGASLHGELKTLAHIGDAVSTITRTPQDQ